MEGYRSCLAVLLMVASLGNAFQCLNRSCHRHQLFLGATNRRSKDELNSMAASVGLKPSAKPKPKPKPKKKKPKDKLGEIRLKAQLDYSRNGSTVLRSFINPHLLQRIRTDLLSYTQGEELEAWRQKVEVGSNDPERAKRCQTIQQCKTELDKLEIGTDNLPFLQYFNTWRDIDSIRKLCYTLGQSASILLDVPSVRLYQDALFTKRSYDGPTPWHTDARMAPFDTSHMLTFWIPLQPVPKDSTGLLFVPKSHNDFALPFWNDFDGPEYSRLEERYEDKTVNYMPLALGDVTVHSGWTLHCADGNESDQNRHALAISFVDAKAAIRETALDFSPSKGGGYAYGDNEDQWSYREWVSQVPKREHFGSHPLVPIVWPLPL